MYVLMGILEMLGRILVNNAQVLVRNVKLAQRSVQLVQGICCFINSNVWIAVLRM